MRCRTRAAAAHEPSGRRPGALAGIAVFAVLIVLAGVVLVPILATALNGFKELGDLQSHPFSLPRVWVWRNYWDVLTGYRYWQVLGNSLLICAPDRLPDPRPVVDGGFHLRASALLRRPLSV